jgi:hypothetical protein
MEDPRDTALKLLKAVTDSVRALKDPELDALMEGKGRLVFVGVARSGIKTGTVREVEDRVNERLQAIVNTLVSRPDRESATNYLVKELQLKKAQLIALADYMKVYVLGSDPKKTVVMKLVEAL